MKPRTQPTHTLRKWLTPGLGVKRWLLLLFLGVTILALGFALMLLQLFRSYPIPPVEFILTLGGSPPWIRALIAGVIGAVMVGLALTRIGQAIFTPLDIGSRDIVDAMMEYRQRGRGPKVVAIGGGTGLPTLLRGLTAHTSNITAIVTVADDGGSSGRLRRDLGVLPPGDIRNNLAALARDENLMTQLFQYRFGEGGLEGHSFGNLFITALSGVTGSFEQALIESSRVLAVPGECCLHALRRDAHGRSARGADQQCGASRASPPSGGARRDRAGLPEARQRPRMLPTPCVLSSPPTWSSSGRGALHQHPANLLVQGIGEAVRHSQALRVYATSPPRRARQTATAWRTTSAPSSGTSAPACLTSCWPTIASSTPVKI